MRVADHHHRACPVCETLVGHQHRHAGHLASSSRRRRRRRGDRGRGRGRRRTHAPSPACSRALPSRRFRRASRYAGSNLRGGAVRAARSSSPRAHGRAAGCRRRGIWPRHRAACPCGRRSRRRGACLPLGRRRTGPRSGHVAVRRCARRGEISTRRASAKQGL